MLIGFRDPQQITAPPNIGALSRLLDSVRSPVEIERIFDSQLAGRDFGLAGLDDSQGPVIIEVLDVRRKQIRATFELEVFAGAAYPPDFANIVRNCDGTVSAVIQGPYEEVSLMDLFP